MPILNPGTASDDFQINVGCVQDVLCKETESTLADIATYECSPENFGYCGAPFGSYESRSYSCDSCTENQKLEFQRDVTLWADEAAVCGGDHSYMKTCDTIVVRDDNTTPGADNQNNI